MEAKELRIGNLVYGVSDRIETVVELDQYSITAYAGKLIESQATFSQEDFSPIPLTEEWLVKFGFNKKGESRYGFKYNYPMADWGFTIEPSFKEGKWFFGHEYYDSGDDNLDYTSLNFCVDLQYVHTLQNIFFALTGEELGLQDV